MVFDVLDVEKQLCREIDRHRVIRGILWCGDVTAYRLRWGNEFLKRKMGPGSDSGISPDTIKRIKRVKKLTKMSENVATGILSEVVKVSGFFTSPFFLGWIQ
ncbi:hypothetical protein LWI28_018521 [Acer negundo]|uniref:Senescence domain-containing protein n=1 Tax=Acer negundo TaxID=4023 RepID=A0AAD5IS70_ACENE|nr:hypothetical protein LWI28_018521 [Acer negundo]KAK4842842.1 hypothetical protein QYF36_000676 [Acer negundo]